MTTHSSFGRIAPLIDALETLARVQREAATRVAADVGCARSSVTLMRALDERPRQLTEIAALLRVDLSVASRHATHLVNARLAERTVDPADRRARMIALTEDGRRLLRKAYTHLGELTEGTFAGWTDADLAEARATLVRLADTIGAAAQPPPGVPSSPAEPLPAGSSA